MNFILINILVLFKIIINEDNNISECKLNSESGSSYNQCKKYSASEGNICCFVSGIINGISNRGCIEMISYFNISNEHDFYGNENNNGDLICSEPNSTKNSSKKINININIIFLILLLLL